MELLVLVLNDPEKLESTLTSLVELGISGATILDSEGMGHYLAYEVPIFAGLRQFVGSGKTRSKTIFALVKDGSVVETVIRVLKEENIDFSRPGTGLIFTVPVGISVKSENDSPA